MKVNKKLIWDYNWDPGEYETGSFKKWYISRVLCYGDIQDIKNIGFEMIKEYIPLIHLPSKIHTFWKWYFSS